MKMSPVFGTPFPYLLCPCPTPAPVSILIPIQKKCNFYCIIYKTTNDLITSFTIIVLCKEQMTKKKIKHISRKDKSHK